VEYIKIPWIQWKNYSCRVDVFATLVYFLFYRDFGEEIFPEIIGPKLPNEMHPLGVLILGMNSAQSIAQIQKEVDKYVTYRAKYKKEKKRNRSSNC